MKVLLLGASGLLGHNVLCGLTAIGHQVVAVVRRHDALKIETPNTVIVEGCITNPETVINAAQGCDAIVNCAGVTDMSLLHFKEYSEINISLCKTILKAMTICGIGRLVHVSTVNTIGYGEADSPADETRDMRDPFADSNYAQSKLAGEHIIIDAAHEHADWHVVVVNPGFMLGPMDVKPSSGRMLLAAYRRRLMFVPQGGKSFVDVRDVATAVVNALTMGRHGERYIAVNSRGCLTLKELFNLQAQVMGYRQRVIVVPNLLLFVAGKVGDAIRFMGIRTELSSCNIKQLMVCEHYNNRRAVNELSMPETDIAQSIRDFYKWRNGK